MFCSGNRCLELVLIAVHIRYTHTHKNPKLQKLEYLESWKCIIKCMQGRWTVDAAYVPYVVFIWKRLCGTLRTCAICPGCSLWYPGQSYAFTDQYNEEIMGRHGQYVWRMQESDTTVIRCRGRGWTVGQPMLGLFLPFAVCTQQISMFGRHVGQRACAICVTYFSCTVIYVPEA